MKASDFFCPKFIAGAMVSLAISAAGYALILKPYHDVSLRSAVVSTNVVASYYAIKDPFNTARQAVDKALIQGSGAAYFVKARIIIEDELKAKGLTYQSTPEELLCRRCLLSLWQAGKTREGHCNGRGYACLPVPRHGCP